MYVKYGVYGCIYILGVHTLDRCFISFSNILSILSILWMDILWAEYLVFKTLAKQLTQPSMPLRTSTKTLASCMYSKVANDSTGLLPAHRASHTIKRFTLHSPVVMLNTNVSQQEQAIM